MRAKQLWHQNKWQGEFLVPNWQRYRDGWRCWRTAWSLGWFWPWLPNRKRTRKRPDLHFGEGRCAAGPQSEASVACFHIPHGDLVVALNGCRKDVATANSRAQASWLCAPLPPCRGMAETHPAGPLQQLRRFCVSSEALSESQGFYCLGEASLQQARTSQKYSTVVNFITRLLFSREETN